MNIDINVPLSVGEVSRRSGVTVATIHFYEAKGLIQSWRSDGNQRRYSREVLRRIAIIRVAQRAGISLLEIKQNLDNLPQGKTLKMKDWKRLSSQWLDSLNNRIISLTRLRDELNNCIGCGCLSMKDCPLRNPGDQLALKGQGAVLLEGDLSRHPRNLP